MSSAATPITPKSEFADNESGYSSGSNSEELPEVYFTAPHLRHINAMLANLEPVDIIRWSLITFPGLYQTTAFGLTGLVTLDMVSKIAKQQKINHPVDLIFLDTLFHFKETLELVETCKILYPTAKFHIYKPDGIETAEEFTKIHGDKLWETNDNLYDFVAKVEPAQRAYADLKVKAVFTGRRKSQGGKRGSLDVVEVDEAGLIKINPMANWSFAQVKEYIDENIVPYNPLLDQGYKSVGDWHSTSPVKEGEDERAGRWKGTGKTECGIHNSRSKYAQYVAEQDRKKQEQALEEALRNVELSAQS
ncbi:hypothetical protein H072_9603 [Dactylellina haptotyla CBS 200.50]|uniref:phosphoadenylyl-sulfate reductase (thioredoxin) n=1 Tax=Dactylellina haptotyla (strain CBS 200.50) TaxID=1284197 RepID=S8A298_DACHA|nr:hypothetical protein H072_9603 [Dactylellina haptotyla CBS 200.50]